MKYPKFVKIDGEKYEINTSFSTALKCFDVVDDETISDSERSLAIIFLLFGFVPENNLDRFLNAAVKYLQCGETKQEQNSKKRDMDFVHDMKYIVSSFMSDYGIDLMNTDMHFYQFINLIIGLTENSALSRVRYLRDYDLSEIKDAKQRKKIIEAQESVKLPEKISKEEQEVLDEFESLFV